MKKIQHMETNILVGEKNKEEARKKEKELLKAKIEL
jgi:hypothetical protein